MDLLADNSTLHMWLIHYGSFALFFLLILGIIALPIPEETLMILAGVLMRKGQLQIPHTILAAFLGSLCGITTSYLLGRTAGHFLIHKYGAWLGIGEKQLEKGQAWFERFGKWTLFIGYFIPGMRHFTGFSAGMTSLHFKDFALFAYSGALIWIATFLSIGYFFGNYWTAIYKDIYENIEISVEHIVILTVLVLIIYLIYQVKYRK